MQGLVASTQVNADEKSLYRTIWRAGAYSAIGRTPVARAGKAMVDTVAAGVNRADWKVREGKSGQRSRG